MSMGGDEEKRALASTATDRPVGLSTEIRNKEVIEQKDKITDGEKAPLLGRKECGFWKLQLYNC
jgi:hypothetical protein